MRKLLTGNGAAAWGMRLAKADYLPAFPITPQTEIIETISQWIEEGEIEATMVTMDSEHSMITAAGTAAATGVRVFTATSSQGLLYAMEMIYTVPGWRAPFVLVNVSRALSSPVTLEPDHNDILAARDSGFLQIHCSTCQEVVDAMLLAYRLAEDDRIRLPVIVNLDGYYLSFTREPVTLPEQEKTDQFLKRTGPEVKGFCASNPCSQGVAVLGGSQYSFFRYETHLASCNGIKVFSEIAAEFESLFGRRYQAVESYRAYDADIVFFMIGSFATKAKDAVNQLRSRGIKAGLVRPLLLRPFPEEAIIKALQNKKGVAVIDQNISLGKGGILYSELASILYNVKKRPEVLVSFIGGLGGRDLTPEDFFEMAKVTTEAADSGVTPPPRLLYTREELAAMHGLQEIALYSDTQTRE
ncbi:MAG: pyruvate synthase [Proteobacteria bacterium]|nr:pyruvate synthase [Pseudomonadota bacterium]MBU1418733.1 pyruvate synthase [Pseudomonadota bacterium]MBU1455960.1 pyruvate synthase [Pseudomonadota bacterium]